MASAEGGALEPLAAGEAAATVGGLTALHAACDAGDTSAIAQLLQSEAGASQLNARDADDRTPLKVAALRGHTEAAALLLAQGAKIGDGDEASARAARDRSNGAHQTRDLERAVAAGALMDRIVVRHRGVQTAAPT